MSENPNTKASGGEGARVRLMTIEFSEEEQAEHRGWRRVVEREGQELWRIYHWIVWVQDGRADGIYRLRDWLEHFNVPDNTGGEHWRSLETAHPGEAGE